MRESDEMQFEEYVEARLPRFRRTAYLICGDWHLADDAVSAAMTKLYLHWAKAQASMNIDAYVRQMVVRSIVDERRRPWRRERPVEFLVVEHAAGSVGLEDRMVLIDALAKMPPRRRAVLVLRFFEGLSVEDTAMSLGIGQGTVKSQTARGLAALRELLPEEYALRYGGSNA